MNENAVELRNVEMHFNMSKEKLESLKEYFLKLVKRQLHYEDFIAVNDVSFDIKKGDVFGIVGVDSVAESRAFKHYLAAFVVAGFFLAFYDLSVNVLLEVCFLNLEFFCRFCDIYFSFDCRGDCRDDFRHRQVSQRAYGRADRPLRQL